MAGAATAAEDRGTFNLLIENDRVAATDRHYSNGIRLSWLSGKDNVPRWVEWAGDRFPLFPEHGIRRVGFAVGQSIFTPADTDAGMLVEDDRPYAGWLYGGVGLTSDSGTRLDSLQLEIGVVGPAALGEETQNTYHEIIDVAESRGWDNQLENEPGIVLAYESKWRGLWESDTGKLGIDLTPHIGGNLGNVFTYAATGIALRFGQNLPADYGPPRIRPSLPGSGFFLQQDGLGWYLFAGVEGRAVLRNIFLDGNTFADSHSVDKKPFVGDLQAGIAVTWNSVRLAYSHVFRTREFEGQPESDRFGALSLSLKY